MSKFSNIGGTSDPEVYKKKYFIEGSFHWETSGKHAYNVLLKNKYEKKEIPQGERVEGLSKEKTKCYSCGKNIKKHSRIIKIEGIPFHVGCAPKEGDL